MNLICIQVKPIEATSSKEEENKKEEVRNCINQLHLKKESGNVQFVTENKITRDQVSSVETSAEKGKENEVTGNELVRINLLYFEPFQSNNSSPQQTITETQEVTLRL